MIEFPTKAFGNDSKVSKSFNIEPISAKAIRSLKLITVLINLYLSSENPVNGNSITHY